MNQILYTYHLSTNLYYHIFPILSTYFYKLLYFFSKNLPIFTSKLLFNFATVYQYFKLSLIHI